MYYTLLGKYLGIKEKRCTIWIITNNSRRNKMGQQKRMNHKAQMQMMETIGVLFIFFVLVLFGFYTDMSQDDKNSQLTQLG